MQVLAVFTENNHYAALERARQISVTAILPSDKAAALLSADASNWLNDIWDQVEIAIGTAAKRGLDAARSALDRVNDMVDQVLGLGMAWVDDVVAVVRARLSEYLKAAVQQALKAVQSTVVVGEQSFKIDRVVLAHSISLSTSVKGSLTEICEFVGEGQFELSAEYAKA
jgi:hypothetical protein